MQDISVTVGGPQLDFKRSSSRCVWGLQHLGPTRLFWALDRPSPLGLNGTLSDKINKGTKDPILKVIDNSVSKGKWLFPFREKQGSQL